MTLAWKLFIIASTLIGIVIWTQIGFIPFVFTVSIFLLIASFILGVFGDY